MAKSQVSGVTVGIMGPVGRGRPGLDGCGRARLIVRLCAEPCPPEAAVCLLGGAKPVNLGRVRDGPQWKDGTTLLKYVDGDPCPDRIRKKSTTIRFACRESQVVSDAATSGSAPVRGRGHDVSPSGGVS